MRCEAPSRLPMNFFEEASDSKFFRETFTPSCCTENAVVQVDYYPLGGGAPRKVWVCSYHQAEANSFQHMQC
jgi:hypothetical protein